MHTLLLWDIDATLILSGGAGERALLASLHQAFGISGTLEGIELAGRTDPLIARGLLAKYEVPATPTNLALFLEGYLANLPGEMANPQSRALPGIAAILETVTSGRTPVAQGLLTGNLRRGAEIKLRHHGLWQHFPFGAFSDDSEHRNDLGPHAVRRARDHHRADFPADRVWIIGDTPHDIECGKAIGARTIGVATGRYSEADLRAHKPTAVLADFSDVALFLQLVSAP